MGEKIIGGSQRGPPVKIRRRVRRLAQGARIVDGLVGRVFLSKQQEERFVILVPKGMRNRVLAVYHGSPVGDHLGALKTLRKVQLS